MLYKRIYMEAERGTWLPEITRELKRAGSQSFYSVSVCMKHTFELWMKYHFRYMYIKTNRRLLILTPKTTITTENFQVKIIKEKCCPIPLRVLQIHPNTLSNLTWK